MCQPRWKTHCYMVCCFTSSKTQILKHRFVLNSRDIIWLFPLQFLIIWLQSCHLVNYIYIYIYTSVFYFSVLDYTKSPYSKVGWCGESMLMWILFLGDDAIRCRLYLWYFTVLYAVFVKCLPCGCSKCCSTCQNKLMCLSCQAVASHVEKLIFKGLITFKRGWMSGLYGMMGNQFNLVLNIMWC
jgi:hypothetical protein